MAKQITTGEYPPVTTIDPNTNMRIVDQHTQAGDTVVFNSKHYEKISNCLRSTKFLIEQLDLCLSNTGITNGELDYHATRSIPTDDPD